MASLSYEKINSRFFRKATAYDFLDIHELDANDMLVEYLHVSFFKPYIRRLFTTLSLDDEIRTANYDMKYNIDAETDEEFVLDLISSGIVVEWITPKINSITNIVQMFGSKEEKWYSEANHLKELQALKNSMINYQRRLIADRGCSWNTYLDGE